MTATLEKLTRQLQYNAPWHDTTWSECPNGCGSYGRGGDPCWNCTRAEMASMAGESRTAEICQEILDAQERARAAGTYATGGTR